MKIRILLLSLILLGGCSYESVNEKEAKSLAEEFLKHPEIKQMNDCSKSQKYVNDIKVHMTKRSLNQSEEGYTEKTRYYKNVLAEQGIKEKDFEYFRKRLEETELNSYYKKDNYSVFITGGMIGDVWGILVVHNQDSIPEEGFRLNEHHYIWIGSQIEEKVYRISG